MYIAGLRSLALTTALLFFCACRDEVELPPNILILIADDVGTDMISAYGAGPDGPRTPNIDVLAKNGVLFQNAWSNPACSTTRATIQTGRYSFRTGVGWLTTSGDGFALALEEQILPEMLDAYAPVAYRHAAFGKWHLGNLSVGGLLAPNLAGYSHFQGTLFNLSTVERYYSWQEIHNGDLVPRDAYVTHATVDAALRWAKSGPEPWLAYVAFHAAHAPYHAPEEVLGTTDPSSPEGLRIQYRWMVEEVDREIGRLMEGLGPESRDRTVVLFAGDNGTPAEVSADPSSPDHMKDSLYQGGISIPFIVSGAGISDPGRFSESLVHTVDVFATVAELAGIDPASLGSSDRPIDSVSLVPYLRDPAARPMRTTLFAERFLPSGYEPTKQSYALRDARYKLIFHLFESTATEEREETWASGLQVFDLVRDPGEERDMLLEEELPPEAAASYRTQRRELHRLATEALRTRAVRRSIP